MKNFVDFFEIYSINLNSSSENRIYFTNPKHPSKFEETEVNKYFIALNCNEIINEHSYTGYIFNNYRIHYSKHSSSMYIDNFSSIKQVMQDLNIPWAIIGPYIMDLSEQLKVCEQMYKLLKSMVDEFPLEFS